MFAPQDLPGRYGRVVRAVDHLLTIMRCPSVMAGGWAVWRHGFVGRVTQDIDIVLPADRIDEFVRLASVSGRIGDEHDVVELIRANPDEVESIRQHVAGIHSDY